VEHESLLSDALLKQLMAVGQVDILVGLPTLNNAATVGDVARAINRSFATDFLRLRTVMIHTDAGSTDGTAEIIRDASFTEGDVVQTSHSLRTLHRVNAPYHGLPGKLAALKTIFAAAALTQARTLVLIDPAGPATSKERIGDLIEPIHRGDVDFVSPRHRRHPREGALITQLTRPLIRAVYRVGLDEPLGAEFSCSGRFASECLDQDIWTQNAARFAIDLWMRTQAICAGLRLGQVWRPAPSSGTTATLREAVKQIFLSIVVCLRAHQEYWTTDGEGQTVTTWGADPPPLPAAAAWDYVTLGRQAREDVANIRPLLEEVLEPPLIARLLDPTPAADPQHDDEAWVRMVYAFLAATNRGSAVEQLADMFVPVYLWRASTFMRHSEADTAEAVQGRLDALCGAFERLRPTLAAAWT
jgi:glucosylglycerate synthase